MKRSIVVLFLLGLIAGLVLTVFSDHDSHSTPVGYSYSGKVLLNDSDYNELKHLLAQPEVRISTLDVYSSEEHLVNFRVRAPAGIQFDYGEIVYTVWKHTPLWDGSIVLISLSVVALLVIGCSYAPEG